MSKGLSAEKAAEVAAFNEMSVKFMQATKAANARLSQRESDLDERAAKLQLREEALLSKESTYIQRIKDLTAALTEQTEIQKRQAEEIEALFRGATSATADGFKALDVSPAVSRTTSLQRDASRERPNCSSSPPHPLRNGSASASGRSQSPGASRLDADACIEVDEQEVNSPTSRRTEPSPTGSSNRSGKNRNPHKYREGALSMEDSRYQVAAEVDDEMLAYTVHDPRIEELSSSHSSYSNPQEEDGAVSEGGRSGGVSPRVKKGIQGRPDFVPMNPEDSGLDFFREGVAADARRRMEREAQQQQAAGDSSSNKTSESDDEEEEKHHRQYHADPLADTTANAAAAQSPLRSGNRRATMEYGEEDPTDQDVAHRLSPQDKQVVDEDNFDDTTTEDDDAREEMQRLRDLASRRELFRRDEDDDEEDDSSNDLHRHHAEDNNSAYENGDEGRTHDDEEDADAIAELEDRFAEAVEWLIDAGHVRDEEHITEILHSGNTPEDVIQWREALEDEENEEEAERLHSEQMEHQRSSSSPKHEQQHAFDGTGIHDSSPPEQQQRDRSHSHEGIVHIDEPSEGGAGGMGEEEDSRPTTIDRQLIGSAAGHGDSVSDAEEENDGDFDGDDDDIQRPRTAYGTRPSRLNGGGDYLQHHHISGRIGGAGRLGGGTSPTSRGGDNDDDHGDDGDASHHHDSDIEEEEDRRAEGGGEADPNDKQRLRVHGEEGDSTAQSEYDGDYEDGDIDSVHSSSAEPFHTTTTTSVAAAPIAPIHHADPHHHDSYTPATSASSSSSSSGDVKDHVPPVGEGHDRDYDDEEYDTHDEPSVEEVDGAVEDVSHIPQQQQQRPPTTTTTTPSTVSAIPNLNIANRMVAPSDSEDVEEASEEDNASFINNDVGGGSSSSTSTTTSDDDDDGLDLPGAASGSIHPPAPTTTTTTQSKPPLSSLKFGGMMNHQDSSDSDDDKEEEDNNNANHKKEIPEVEDDVEDHKYEKIEEDYSSSSYSSESQCTSDDPIMDLPQSPKAPLPSTLAAAASSPSQPKATATTVPKRMVALSNFDDTSSEEED